MVGAIRFEPDPLLQKQGSSLLKYYFNYTYGDGRCVLCQKMAKSAYQIGTNLAQYFLLLFTPNPKQEFHAISSCYSLVCLVSHSQIYVIHIFTERILKHFLNFYQYNKKTHNQKGNKNAIKTECCKLGA